MSSPDFTAHRHPVLAVACPSCGANVGAWCKRPSGHKAMDLHAGRKAAADAAWEDAGSIPIVVKAGGGFAYGRARQAAGGACKTSARTQSSRGVERGGEAMKAGPMKPAELERIRARLDLSQERLGRLFGLAPRTMRRLVAGESEIPIALAVCLRLLDAGRLELAEIDRAFRG